MATLQAPVTEIGQCPLYRLLVSERHTLNASIRRLARGAAPQYEPLNARSRAAGMVQHSICHQRARGGQPRAGSLALIEETIDHLPADEQGDILEALGACRAGCALTR
jgi:hypothetical protein